jgi:ferritin
MPELGKKLLDELNKQIQEELYSAYLYYAMAAWFDAGNLTGFAHWMRVQAMEEVTHAQKFYNHIYERGNEVELLEIAKPPSSWKSPLAAFEASLEHERHITGRINLLVDIARKENDYSAEVSLLNWFVEEQVEEEATAMEMIHKLKLIGDSKNGLYMLDKEVGSREFNQPTGFAW